MKSKDIYEALNSVMQKSLEGTQDIEQGRLVINSATRATELFQAELRQQKLDMERGVSLKEIGNTIFVDKK
jgi:hypothetical protein